MRIIIKHCITKSNNGQLTSGYLLGRHTQEIRHGASEASVLYKDRIDYLRRIAGGGGRIAGGGGRIAGGGGRIAGGGGRIAAAAGGGRIAAGGGRIAGGLFAGGLFAGGLIAGGPFAGGLNAAHHQYACARCIVDGQLHNDIVSHTCVRNYGDHLLLLTKALDRRPCVVAAVIFHYDSWRYESCCNQIA